MTKYIVKASAGNQRKIIADSLTFGQKKWDTIRILGVVMNSSKDVKAHVE